MRKQIKKFLIKLIKRNNKAKKVNDNIPDDILMLYGKFYFYSLCYMVIFGVLYPLLFIGNISTISLVLSFIVLIGLYVYMIYDVLKKSKGFKSAVFSLFVVLVILAITISIVKIFI